MPVGTPKWPHLLGKWREGSRHYFWFRNTDERIASLSAVMKATETIKGNMQKEQKTDQRQDVGVRTEDAQDTKVERARMWEEADKRCHPNKGAQ